MSVNRLLIIGWIWWRMVGTPVPVVGVEVPGWGKISYSWSCTGLEGTGTCGRQ